MNPMFLSALGNHLWQSTVVWAVAGLLTLALRKYRAHVRYWVWFTASIKFLMPFSLLISLGSAMRWPTGQSTASPPSMVVVATEIAQPFVVSTTAPLRPSSVGTMRQYVPALLFIAWLVGFLIIVALWARSWWRMRAIIRGASPVVIPSNIQAMASPALLEPSVFGIFRPVLVVPQNIHERLSEEQLHSVVAHEMWHIRRRDNLLSSVHMTVAAIFWFYPVVWWLGARLLEERERACDEQVVRQGNAPHVYAEAILQVCKSYLESPLRCASGVSGANLQRRIEAIISGSAVHNLNFGAMLLLTVSAVAALMIPFAVGMVKAFPLSQEITRPANTPKWEVVSIKPCKGGEGRGEGPFFSPGRANWNCQTLRAWVNQAYVINPKGILGAFNVGIVGGPSWIESDRYTIAAKAEGTPSNEMMGGPMLQELLEDRFKLRMHRETREIPVYMLTVAKTGAKLQPFKEGSCIPIDLVKSLLPPPLAPGEKRCTGSSRPKGPNRTIDAEGITIDMLAVYLRQSLERRPIINKTGIAGMFNFHLEYANPTLGVAPTAGDEPIGPSIFAEVERLGLKLESTKGPGEFLVIDSVEIPSEN